MTLLDHSVLKRIRNLALFNDKQLNNLATRLEPKTAAPKQRIIGLGDLILVARYYSLLGTPSENTLPSLSKMPAFLKLQLEFNAEESESFIEESRAEVAAVESMLGSV